MALSARATHTAEPQPAWLDSMAAAVRAGWQAYWDRRARRATVVLLQSLDELHLRDIGINRSEIESVVYGPPIERRRSYHGGGCW